MSGQFFDRMNIIAVTSGYVGNVPLVNGARYPEARTTRGWVRLRLLDGSNARSYLLKASDNRSLFVIGSDGGLLETPVEMKQIMMYAGERFEVMVDCRSGTPFDLVALPVGAPIMRLPPFDGPVPLVTIRPDGADGAGQLPNSLAKLPPLPAALPAVSQELVMNMFRDDAGMMPLMKAGLGGPAMWPEKRQDRPGRHCACQQTDRGPTGTVHGGAAFRQRRQRQAFCARRAGLCRAAWPGLALAHFRRR